MLQIHVPTQHLSLALLVVTLSTPLFALAGESPQELRCLGMYRSHAIGKPGSDAVNDPVQTEQYLIIEDARLVIQDSDETYIEYSLCKATDGQRQYSNQCDLTPKRFIAGWRAIGRRIATPKGQGAQPATVDHVEIDSPSMAIRWTHLAKTMIASRKKGGVMQVYFVGAEFEGKCVPAQMLL